MASSVEVRFSRVLMRFFFFFFSCVLKKKKKRSGRSAVASFLPVFFIYRNRRFRNQLLAVSPEIRRPFDSPLHAKQENLLKKCLSNKWHPSSYVPTRHETPVKDNRCFFVLESLLGEKKTQLLQLLRGTYTIEKIRFASNVYQASRPRCNT